MKRKKTPLSLSLSASTTHFASVFTLAFVFVFILLLISPPSIYSFQDIQTPASGEEQAVEIQPGPQNIKEKIALFVFTAWLWISIVIIVFLLILKIKEADRLHQMGYFHSPRGKKFLRKESPE
jgi:hypothetical protein